MSRNRDISKLLSTSNGKIAGANLDVSFENITDTGTEGTRVATGTTAQRGSATGQWRYNTTTGFFEGRNAGGDFSTLEPSPTISGVDVTEVDSNAGGNQTFVISGANFTTGGTIAFVGTSAQFNATTTTHNSGTQQTAVAPKASFLNAQEPYKIKFTSASGVAGTSATGLISVDTAPSWTTNAGSLGTLYEGDTANISTSATDADSDTIAYTIQSGSLPTGLGLNGSTGAITGTTGTVSADTTSNFTLRATANSKTADRAFSIVVKDALEQDSNTLAYFDFASGKSYDGTSTLQDLTSRNKDLPFGSNVSHSTANGGVLVGSSNQNVRATGLTGSVSSISMGVWVKLQGVTSGKGVIYYGDTGTNNHFFIRDAINGEAYNFDIGKDISGSDTWTRSKYNGNDMNDYITSVSGYANKFWYYVVRIDSNGHVTTSLNKSTFETTISTGGGTINGHSSGQFGIFGDPYDDNSSSHTIGVAYWYNGLISQAKADAIYDRYATRFGY
tara:strand:+ start:1917 stop:3422 length:1506 start_codon:yes stop_codon:yes gene_type:complete